MGAALIPTPAPGPSCEEGLSPAMRRQAEMFERAMAERLAMPPSLRRALDGAAVGGLVSSAADLSAAIRAMDGEGPAPEGAWDGRVDGEALWDAPEAGWCTVRQHYGWGIPGAEAMQAILEAARPAGRLVEVGAGCGYWAAVLASRGLDVLALDDRSWRADRWDRTWHPVAERDGPEAVAANPGVPVLIVWEAGGAGMRAVSAMEPGRLLIRAGSDAFTGDAAFNAACREMFDLVAEAPCTTCAGGDERVAVLRRRP